MATAAGTDIYTIMRNLRWSATEKSIARKAFEDALETELQSTVAEFKSRAGRAKHASELWEIEVWLAERRKEINEKYDYRYSVLPMVFGRLINEDRIQEDQLRGLRTDKLELIRRIAAF
jgi:hypothetical protein